MTTLTNETKFEELVKLIFPYLWKKSSYPSTPKVKQYASIEEYYAATEEYNKYSLLKELLKFKIPKQGTWFKVNINNQEYGILMLSSITNTTFKLTEWKEKMPNPFWFKLATIF